MRVALQEVERERHARECVEDKVLELVCPDHAEGEDSGGDCGGVRQGRLWDGVVPPAQRVHRRGAADGAIAPMHNAVSNGEDRDGPGSSAVSDFVMIDIVTSSGENIIQEKEDSF